MHVYPDGLTDAYVRASLAQMEHAITVQYLAMTAQVNLHNVERQNPQVSIMADRLRDFTRMKTLEKNQNFSTLKEHKNNIQTRKLT